MIPFAAVVSFHDRETRRLRVWVPLILVWLLLMPLFLLLSPLILIAALAFEVNPFRGCGVVLQILSGLRKTEVEVDHRSAGVSICIL
jgi:hypothetical protein